MASWPSYGSAAQVSCDTDRSTTGCLKKLLAVLNSRYSGEREAEKHRVELQIRRRKTDESLSKLHQDIRYGLIIDRLAKFFGKFIPETRCGMAQRAIVDFQRGIRRWTSKCYNIRGTSAAKWLTRNKIIEIRWFGGSKDFVSKRKHLIVYSFFNFEPM